MPMMADPFTPLRVSSTMTNRPIIIVTKFTITAGNASVMAACAAPGVSAPMKSLSTKNVLPWLSMTAAFEPMPMSSSMRPSAGPMPSFTQVGIASTIFSRMLHNVSTTNTMPSARVMTSAAWYDATYERPVTVAICATNSAKKLLRPMPGARQNGLFARNAMQIMAMPEARHVARNTAFQSASPPARQLVSRFGFNAMMYAIVMNVVKPATTSVLTFVPFSLSLNSFSTSAPFILCGPGFSSVASYHEDRAKGKRPEAEAPGRFRMRVAAGFARV